MIWWTDNGFVTTMAFAIGHCGSCRYEVESGRVVQYHQQLMIWLHSDAGHAGPMWVYIDEHLPAPLSPELFPAWTIIC